MGDLLHLIFKEINGCNELSVDRRSLEIVIGFLFQN